MKPRFDNIEAVVSGAASGIGREVVRGLAGEGATRIFCIDLDAFRLEELQQELAPTGCDLHLITGDVADENTWRRTAEAIDESTIRVLVNNAGIAHIKPLKETSVEDWHQVMDVNLTSIFLSAKYLFPLLGAGGSVINVSSVAALVGQTNTPAYIASKGGVVAFTRGLAVDFAAQGLRVNVVCPGPTDTPLLRRHFNLLKEGATAQSQLETRIPLGRLLEAADVAPLILFLASADAAMVTGATFVVDGGLSATFDYGGGLVQTETEA